MNFLTEEEGRQLFDRTARELMRMSGERFKRLWAEGKIKDPDRPEVISVLALLPLAG